MDKKTKQWLMNVISGLIKHPEVADFGTRTGRLDLEVIIAVAPEDRRVFTEKICLALTTLVAAATGVLAPVVYLSGDPHPAAKEALSYADHQL